MFLLLACSTPFDLPVTEAPELAYTDVGSADVPKAAALLLNEVQTVNDSTIMADDLTFPDWLELYNAGDEAISLTDVRIEAGSGTWEGGGGSLAPGARLVLWADGLDAAGHLPFALDGDGEEITVDVGGVATDRLATGRMAGDTAWARYPDGGSWAYTARPTPDATNGRDPGQTTDPSDALFPDDRILDFSLTIPDASWDALNADPYGEVDASVAYGPAFFQHVSVRLKGVYGSLRSLTGKAAFKVDLNAYADHHLRGLETLTFNNMVQDPSYTHEVLAYAFYRAMGLPAPRTGFMRLSVNGEDWGLYLNVESVDDTFLARWWADPSGRMYEGSYGDDFTIGEEQDFEYDEGPDPEDRTDITAVATILEGVATDDALAELEEKVDMDQVLSELAVEAVLLHWDGYTTANNYRVYHDPVTDRFQMIPWGTDQTFHDEWYGPYDGYGELMTFCLENAACTARYDLALLAAADTFEQLDVEGDLDYYTAFLAEDVATDVRREQTAETIATYIEDTRAVIRASPARIRAAVGE